MSEQHSHQLDVIVVGAGLGGLATAIACAKGGLKVRLLEKASEFLPVGAGIQIPPNGVRALRKLGLEDKIRASGAVPLDAINLKDFSDGRRLLRRPGGQEFIQDYGAPWYVVHRADYHRLLLQEAERLGVRIDLDSEVRSLNFDPGRAKLTTRSGKTLDAEVIVGADGLWSLTRSLILHKDIEPIATGDMAYRATFAAEQLRSIRNDQLNALISTPEVNVWMGPNAHAVLYPIKNGDMYNLVLLCPDTLPPGFRAIEADVEEMKAAFAGWDQTLTDALSLVTKVSKWRLCHQHELPRWTQGRVVIIGDASHPTLPYQAQGAAMAVEDGSILGHLLQRLQHLLDSSNISESQVVPAILEVFEGLRKQRTAVNVAGAVDNQRLFHLADPVECEVRNEMLADTNWKTQTKTTYRWNDLSYLSDMLGFDFIADADRAFDQWRSGWDKKIASKLNLESVVKVV